MIISVDAEKAFDQIECTCVIRNTCQVRYRGKLNIVKATYKGPVANAGIRPRTCPLGSGTREGCFLLTGPFNPVLEVVTREIGQEKAVSSDQNGKGKK